MDSTIHINDFVDENSKSSSDCRSFIFIKIREKFIGSINDLIK